MHQGPTLIASNCSAFVPSTGVTIRGALTICNGSRSVTELIVLNEEANGKRAIATWASPFGTLPIHRVLLIVRKTVPGFHELVGHHESAGKSILEYCCFPFLSISSTSTFRGGGLEVFTLQYVVTCIKGVTMLNELGGAIL